MAYLVVCPVSQVRAVGLKHHPSHMLTVMSEKSDVPRPASVSAVNHKSLIFNDIAEDRDGLVAPGAAHVEALLTFAQAWDRKAPLLIHCYAGVSRSTASAYIIANALADDADPVTIASDLRFRSPSATPNARMIALADAQLGMGGAMIDAIAHIGRGADCFEGDPFVFPLRADQADLF